MNTNETQEKIASMVVNWSELGLAHGLSYGASLLSALVLVIAGLFLSKFMSRALRARLEELEGFDETLVPVLTQVVRYGIILFTLILVLAEFGIQTASIIAVLGAAGLAIGLALQGTLQNVSAGIMLLFLRPFQSGDYIDAAGVSGTVYEIGLFMTQLHTPQNLYVAVPNGKIWADTIINYSKLPHRRLDIVASISYEDDIEKAIAVLKHMVAQNDRLLKQPEPQFLISALSASSVDLELRVWVDRKNAIVLASELRRGIKEYMEKFGVSIPYPHHAVIVKSLNTAAAGDLERV